MSGEQTPLADEDRVLRDYFALRDRTVRLIEALVTAAETLDGSCGESWVRADVAAFRRCLERLEGSS